MTVLLVMPGTGSDADYAARVFGTAADAIGAHVIALEPEAELVDGYLRQLRDHAPAADDLLVGGISIGAAIAVDWVLRDRPANCRGVWAALPPWSGPPRDSLAALSAQLTADGIESAGLDATCEQMAQTSPDWLAAELSRSWRALAARGLVSQLRNAAAYAAPSEDFVAGLPVPLGVAAAPDDPLHPIQVGRAWAQRAPRAALAEVPLTRFGPAPQLLGEACRQAWTAASSGDGAAGATWPSP